MGESATSGQMNRVNEMGKSKPSRKLSQQNEKKGAERTDTRFRGTAVLAMYSEDRKRDEKSVYPEKKSENN